METYEVTLSKDRLGLGITIAGYVCEREAISGIFVKSIAKRSVADVCKKICINDQIIEVNGQCLQGFTNQEAVEQLRKTGRTISMRLARYLPPGINSDILGSDGSITTSANLKPCQHVSDDFHVSPLRQDTQICQSGSVSKGTCHHSITSKVTNNEENVRWNRSYLSPTHVRWRSLTKMTVWSSEINLIHLTKNQRGLGFSVLDYQDPMNPSETVIVVRSLVPGGAAENDGHLIPGDRLLFVNDISLEGETLEFAVQALKMAPQGTVCLGIAKPLPLPESVVDKREPQTQRKTLLKSQTL